MKFISNKRLRWGIPLAAVIVLMTGGIVYAAIPSSTGVIHGCVKPGQGGLRVIDTDKGESCLSVEKPLTWNQTGPQGPPGASDAFAKVVNGPVTAGAGGPTTIASLAIPLAGKYVVSSKMFLTYDNTLFTSVVYGCTLESGSDVDVTRGSAAGEGGTPSAQAPVSGMIVNSLVHEFTAAGTIDLKCFLGNPSSLNYIKITAIRVGNLTTS